MVVTPEHRSLTPNFESYLRHQGDLLKAIGRHKGDYVGKEQFDFDKLLLPIFKENNIRLPNDFIEQLGFWELGWQRAGFGPALLYIGDPEFHKKGIIPLERAAGTIEIARSREEGAQLVRIAGFDQAAGRVLAAKYAVLASRTLIELNVSLTLDEYEILQQSDPAVTRAVTTQLPTNLERPYHTAGLITEAMQHSTSSARDNSPHPYALLLQRQPDLPTHFGPPQVQGAIQLRENYNS